MQDALTATKSWNLREKVTEKYLYASAASEKKLSAFNKRKENESTSISKKEASKYLSTQNKKQDENINTALAEALAKLKL